MEKSIQASIAEACLIFNTQFYLMKKLIFWKCSGARVIFYTRF